LLLIQGKISLETFEEWNRFRTKAASLLTLLLAVVPFIGPVPTSAGNRPEDVVWKYIDGEFEEVARDPTYWKRRWHFDGDLKRDDIRLGKPYSEYHLNAEELALFVRSGDLIGAAFLMDVSYPIFRKKELIGSVQVIDSLVATPGESLEQAHQWRFVSRHLVGPVDSLAAARGERGESIAILSAKGLGAFVLVTPAASSETRVYPLSGNEALDRKKDKGGSVSYATACEVLRPQADDWLKEHGSRINR
jgi:hypothetical protein